MGGSSFEELPPISVYYPAQQDNFETSLLYPSATSFNPSVIVKYVLITSEQFMS